ncbi:MAG: hypothetical protein ACI8PZ_000535 [Myxococcota bacterium]|jgi:hypothetical protein
MTDTPRSIAVAVFLISASAILFELGLTRLFGVVLFASFAHLALAVALMGIAAGAVAQHLRPSLVPAEGLEERLGWVALAQVITSLLAVAVALAVPLTVQDDLPPADFVRSRLNVKWDLIQPWAFAALLPALTAPFACAGLAFAGVFQRRREHVGTLYGADLVGGAVGALAFVPLLYALSAPDLVFVVAALGCAAAAVSFHAAAKRGLTLASVAATVALGGVAAVATTQDTVLHVRYPAGFSEDYVVRERWTPVARLALHDAPDDRRVLLDNSSSSEVVLTADDGARQARSLVRSLVFRLHQGQGGGRVAVLAASAGPDVAVAQFYGFRDIDAIDVVPDIGDLIAEQWPDATHAPLQQPGVRRVFADARSAVLHAERPYDVIMMLHANLHGANGLLADAWSPALLGTTEAFSTYLDQLTPDGTVSFARGSRTPFMVQSAVAALEARGVSEPWRHVLYTAPADVLLVKPRPFTAAERARVLTILEDYPRQRLVVDPLAEPDEAARAAMWGNPAMTDDRPYTDTASEVVAVWRDAVARWFGAGGEDRVRPEYVLFYVMMVEVLAVLLAGLGVVFLPWAWSRRTQGAVPRSAPVLGFVACLGYGYLAVEIVLVHELVLYLGHPVIAVTAVVFTMLVTSGLGSLWAQGLARDRIDRWLPWLLGAVVALGAVQAVLVPGVLRTVALGWPLWARVGLCAALLAPLGAVMGTPFTLAMRRLRPEAEAVVPWAWALNGWMSVAASLGTVMVSRLVGYRWALLVALIAYGIAALLARGIGAAGQTTSEDAWT